VIHAPRDDVGGGSAWAAGFIDYSCEALEGGIAVDAQKRLRRADLLAALCQETIGDHSVAPRRLLRAIESKFESKAARLVDEDLEELHISLERNK